MANIVGIVNSLLAPDRPAIQNIINLIKVLQLSEIDFLFTFQI